MIGKISIYDEEEHLVKQDTAIAFVLFGKIKIYNKDYRSVLEKGDTFGEHPLFHYHIDLKAKSLE